MTVRSGALPDRQDVIPTGRAPWEPRPNDGEAPTAVENVVLPDYSRIVLVNRYAWRSILNA